MDSTPITNFFESHIDEIKEQKHNYIKTLYEAFIAENPEYLGKLTHAAFSSRLYHFRERLTFEPAPDQHLSSHLQTFFNAHIEDIEARKQNFTKTLYSAFIAEHEEYKNTLSYQNFYRRMHYFTKTKPQKDKSIITKVNERGYLLPNEVQAFYNEAFAQINNQVSSN